MAGFGFGLPSIEETRKLAAWNNTAEIPGYDPRLWRMDAFGNPVRWSDHGDTSSGYGWQIDHITPTALGGTDALSNLRALRCEVNAGLGGLLGAALRRRRDS